MDVVRISKRLSYVLRHRPDSIGITLDAAGWAPIDDLLAALASHGLPLTRAGLEDVVREDDKRRFTIDAAGTRIRAAQGHSTSVDLGYPPTDPPPVLYHGTAARAVGAILREGLSRRGRHAVHLSPDPDAAARVGARRGAHSVLRVDAAAMARDGASFACSDNGVWLTESVPPQYIRREP